MKKISLFIIILLLCACGGNSSTSEDTLISDVSSLSSSEITVETISSKNFENTSSKVELGWH